MELHGFIMLHRKMLDWEWYEDANVRSVFIHLLLLASFKPGKWRGIEIAPGQVVTSYAHLKQRLHLSYSQVRTALEKLQSTGEIKVKSTTQYTLITLENWAFYQGDREKIDNESTTNRQQINNKSTHRNNVNNVNNVNKGKAAPKLQVFNPDKYDYESIHKQARERIKKRVGEYKAG